MRRAERMLQSATRAGWAAIAVDRLELTLIDHAHCEKKAAASAIALVNDYPEDSELVRALGRLAEEEIGHFREVHELIAANGSALSRDRGDPYARELLALVRKENEHRKLDRLLVCALIEARSCERFGLLKAELERRGNVALAARFRTLESSEAGHAALFVELATARFGEPKTRARLEELAAREAEIVAALPLAPRIH